ncbi:unnamed protein product [Protopolystoma xenopodis]|uniref:Uncharacterized protein n=1 Tax=Protopolystoma xenopodis TaxID=117903 RepID=A0A3S5A7L3_9PLAT|nr:unnamed protein product [Protopolystoma xenopodis]
MPSSRSDAGNCANYYNKGVGTRCVKASCENEVNSLHEIASAAPEQWSFRNFAKKLIRIQFLRIDSRAIRALMEKKDEIGRGKTNDCTRDWDLHKSEGQKNEHLQMP